MFHIHWSEMSEITYAEILEPLSQDDALELDEKVEELIDRLRLYRFFCPPSKIHPNLRNCIVNKKIGLVYQVDKQVVSLLYFYYQKSSMQR